MPWLLLLHITALLCWCGSLLYLPALIAGRARRELLEPYNRFEITRKVFTLFVTPAALIAIASGTAVFISQQIVAAWLILKLTLVVGLVLCHVATGWLAFHIEQAPRRYGVIYCGLAGTLSAAFMAGILWLVLAKPF